MPTFIKSLQDIQQIESFFGKDWKTTKIIQQRYNLHKPDLQKQRREAVDNKKNLNSPKNLLN